jgi:hypothetical protein
MFAIHGDHQEHITCDWFALSSKLVNTETVNHFSRHDKSRKLQNAHSKFVHLFQHSTDAEQLSLELEQLTKDPAQINVQIFINASVQIKKILHYAVMDRKVNYLITSVLLYYIYWTILLYIMYANIV